MVYFLTFLRKFLNTCVLYGVAYHIWSSFVLLQLDDRDSDDESREPSLRETRPRRVDRGYPENDSHEIEVMDEEDSIFLPLDRPRHRQGESYVFSDPEWQQFVKIAGDGEKMKSLKGMASALPTTPPPCIYLQWSR